MDEQIIGVKEFIGLLNETLKFAYPYVTIEGEVSGFKAGDKWVSFFLKEEDATLPCFTSVYQLKTPLEDGMQIRVSGNPRVHAKSGKFSVYVQAVALSGEGALRRAFELLKQKMEKEGLFAAERKRTLPTYPANLGLITSAGSAAYADFVKILDQRWRGISVSLADVQVQGMKAPEQIVAAVNYFNQLPKPVDVLVIIRGGGSLEDLAAFNTESVARAIAASRTPTIVGVGHEVDVSLADYAADLRAATPTDAARIVVPDMHQTVRTLNFLGQQMHQQMRRVVGELNLLLRREVGAMERFWAMPKERLLVQANLLARSFHRLESAVSGHQAELNRQGANLNWQMKSLLNSGREQLKSAARLLRNFDVKAVLARGYSVVQSQGKLVRRWHDVKAGDELMIQLQEGKLGGVVKYGQKDGAN